MEPNVYTKAAQETKLVAAVLGAMDNDLMLHGDNWQLATNLVSETIQGKSNDMEEPVRVMKEQLMTMDLNTEKTIVVDSLGGLSKRELLAKQAKRIPKTPSEESIRRKKKRNKKLAQQSRKRNRRN